MNYAAPWWLPGGNLQTIWAALRSQRFLGQQPLFRRERWTTPDSDFVDVDWLDGAPTRVASRTALPPEGGHFSLGRPQGKTAVPSLGNDQQPLLVVFHGLEGSSASHYAEAFADVARSRGWACAVPHFRGCSGELNLGPRAYTRVILPRSTGFSNASPASRPAR